MTSRSFATLALASSSRLRAPKTRTSRPLTTTPSGALNDTEGTQSQPPQSTTRHKRPERPPPASAPPSAALHSARSSHRTANYSSTSALGQQTSESARTSQFSSGEGERPLLRPYELSRRLIAHFQRGDFNGAVTVLKRAPRNAQNIKVWNTIIQQCMNAKKYNLAFRVFTDMKRRGFIPNVRTYATMMSGYATIDDWKPLNKQLGFVHSVYGQLKQHLERNSNLIGDPAGESGVSFILYPIALYISILGKAGKYQRAFDVFHHLDTDGPLAPHPKIYSSLLSVFADRVDSADVDAVAIAKSVSEAKYIWRSHMRSLDKQPQHHVEPRSIEAMIKVLSRGEPPDHELMFDILRDICGLSRLGEDLPSSPSREKKVSPNMWILNEVLDGCIIAGRPEMAVHYAQSVMTTRELHPILSAWHLNKLLRAHIHLAKEGSKSSDRSENVAAWVEWMVAQDPTRDPSKTTPNERTFVSALELCNRCKDTHSALRIVRAVATADMHGISSPSLPIKAWEYLFHLATVAGQDEKRQCLELLSTHSSVLDVWKTTSVQRLPPPEKKAHESLAVHIVQVSKAVLPSSDHEGAGSPDAAELEVWSGIRRRAESFLEKTHRHKRKR